MIAIAVLVVSVATSVGLFGWAVAILIAAYVVVMSVRRGRQ